MSDSKESKSFLSSGLGPLSRRPLWSQRDRARPDRPKPERPIPEGGETAGPKIDPQALKPRTLPRIGPPAEKVKLSEDALREQKYGLLDLPPFTLGHYQPPDAMEHLINARPSYFNVGPSPVAGSGRWYDMIRAPSNAVRALSWISISVKAIDNDFLIVHYNSDDVTVRSLMRMQTAAGFLGDAYPLLFPANYFFLLPAGEQIGARNFKGDPRDIGLRGFYIDIPLDLKLKK